MSACPNCGAIPRPTDKFCNTCGTPVVQAPVQGNPSAVQGGQGSGGYGAPSPAGGGAYGPPPPQAAPWGAPPPPAAARCQLGHDISPGASYCVQGHPIALEGVQFAGPGAGQAGYGGPPQAGPQAGYGPPQGQPYAAPQGYAQPAPPPPFGGGYPQPGQGYGGGQGPFPGSASPVPQPLPGYAAPPPVAASIDAPPTAASPQGAIKLLRGFLVSFQATPAGDFWPLYVGRHTVGRANSGESLDVPLADATISSKHAVLVLDAMTGSILVEDTGSTNGTFVNDEHLGFNGRRELKDGDRLRFGGFNTIVKVVARP